MAEGILWRTCWDSALNIYHVILQYVGEYGMQIKCSPCMMRFWREVGREEK